jgi:hypothetical protein
MLKSKKQKMLAAMVLASSALGVSGASAWGNSLLNIDLKDFAPLQQVLSFYDSMGRQFAAEFQNYSTITEAAINELIGAQGQFSPTQTKQETEKKFDKDNLLSSSINTGMTALGTNDLAGQQVLSKESQEGTKTVKKEMESLDKLTVNVSDEVYYRSQEAQTSTSSQEVLKKISAQLSGQADIAAAQTRLSVIQNTSAQDLKVNLAALNVAAASQLEREMGKTQAEQIAKMGNQTAHVNAVARNLLMPTQ